jgi:hypothetical protein
MHICKKRNLISDETLVGSGKKGKFALQDHFYPQDFKNKPKGKDSFSRILGDGHPG